jgi:hypothetical protein
MGKVENNPPSVATLDSDPVVAVDSVATLVEIGKRVEVSLSSLSLIFSVVVNADWVEENSAELAVCSECEKNSESVVGSSE